MLRIKGSAWLLHYYSIYSEVKERVVNLSQIKAPSRMCSKCWEQRVVAPDKQYHTLAENSNFSVFLSFISQIVNLIDQL